MDAFVRAHPDFSWNGARGTIALTGYEGILGYHTQAKSDNRKSEITAVKPIIARLKETGWDFASHGWGHLDAKKASLKSLKWDSDRWDNEVRTLVGPANILIYPYGEDCQDNAEKMQYLLDKGFRIFCPVGTEAYVCFSKTIPAVFMDRMHPDGTTLRQRRSAYLKFYDAKEVFDPARLLSIPVDFSK